MTALPPDRQSAPALPSKSCSSAHYSLIAGLARSTEFLPATPPRPRPNLKRINRRAALLADGTERPDDHEQRSLRQDLDRRLRLHDLPRPLPDRHREHGQAAERRGERSAGSAGHVSPSIPMNDTPAVLAVYANHYGAEQGPLVVPDRAGKAAGRPDPERIFQARGQDNRGNALPRASSP